MCTIIELRVEVVGDVINVNMYIIMQKSIVLFKIRWITLVLSTCEYLLYIQVGNLCVQNIHRNISTWILFQRSHRD
jgi:hypothetical protein